MTDQCLLFVFEKNMVLPFTFQKQSCFFSKAMLNQLYLSILVNFTCSYVICPNVTCHMYKLRCPIGCTKISKFVHDVKALMTVLLFHQNQQSITCHIAEAEPICKVLLHKLQTELFAMCHQTSLQVLVAHAEFGMLCVVKAQGTSLSLDLLQPFGGLCHCLHH